MDALKSINVSPGSWAISSQIAETLEILGAIGTPEGMTESVAAEIESLLIDDEDAVDKELAVSVCSRIFDGVYGEAYYNEIMALDSERRHRLFRRALDSPKVKQSFNFVWLCNQVAAFDDVADIPTFAAFAELPDVSNPFPQEEWGGFVLAVRFLGGYGAALPSVASEVAPGSLPERYPSADSCSRRRISRQRFRGEAGMGAAACNVAAAGHRVLERGERGTHPLGLA
ncbi:MAG: hypothetical protein WDO68_01905 [Gammaproteobacteria bacterium]